MKIFVVPRTTSHVDPPGARALAPGATHAENKKDIIVKKAN